jgi:hypothetical protein
MKLKELKSGQMFNIASTPSYPKLKIEGGYVDMRDDIKNVSGNCDNREVTIMTTQDIANEMKQPIEVIIGWEREIRNKYFK